MADITSIGSIDFGKLYPGDQINWNGSIAKITGAQEGRKFTIFLPTTITVTSEDKSYSFNLSLQYDKYVVCDSNGEAEIVVTISGQVPLDAPFQTYSADITVRAVG